jgi:cobalamin synthase
MVFTEYATWKGLAIASLPLVAIAYVHPAYSIPAASVIAGAVMWGLYCNAKIGGVTGDTLGASIRLSETIALSAIVAMV